MSAALEAARWLRDATSDVAPGAPVAVTYNPLQYAWRPHAAYLERFGAAPKRALLVGMNPGHWGMGQNGVPFGEKDLAADWLGLGGIPVQAPAVQHPKRPVDGWACTRSEPSGKRLWGLLRDVYGTPEAALRDLLIVNHCPLLMFDERGTNITPDKLRKADCEALYAVCDEGLARMVDAMSPEVLIGVGKYAEGRCRSIAEDRDLRVTHIMHPSPASPLANREGGAYWRRETLGCLEREGLLPSGGQTSGASSSVSSSVR